MMIEALGSLPRNPPDIPCGEKMLQVDSGLFKPPRRCVEGSSLSTLPTQRPALLLKAGKISHHDFISSSPDLYPRWN